MNTNGIFEIVLFPIPGCVSFPQTVVPLHVFEPRYRQMIKDCVDNKKLLGVCHTKSIERFAPKILNEVTQKKDLDSFYKQNLSTFSPEDVFSAGTVDILETTEDGRYAVNVNMLKRFRVLNLTQNTPYKVANCEEYSDSEILDFNNSSQEINDQKNFIISFLEDEIAKFDPNEKVQLIDLYNEPLINKFTFKVFRYIRMEEHEMQSVLNLKDPIARIEVVTNFIKKLKY